MNRPLLAASAAAAILATAPAAAQTVLTASSWIHPTHALSVSLREWCDLVEKNSTGKVKCNILPRHVSTPAGTYDAVRNGVVDVSFTVHGYTPGRFVLTKMTEFPFLADHAEPLSVAFHRVASRHPQFSAEHPGVKVLAYFTHGPGMPFNTKRAVTRLEDMQGLKWRVGGGFINDIAKVLGLNVTLKPATEAYELMSGGVMDGTLFPVESIEGFKLEKIVKHATAFPGGLYNTSFVWMINPAKYERLTPDEKKAVDAASGEVLARLVGRQWDKADRLSYAVMQANNVQMTKADGKFVADMKSRIQPLEQQWVKDAEAKGLKDAAKVLAEFRSEIAKASK
jgi:TRAP-type C4-dicarboxylate transport system substrate-binding protein